MAGLNFNTTEKAGLLISAEKQPACTPASPQILLLVVIGTQLHNGKLHQPAALMSAGIADWSEVVLLLLQEVQRKFEKYGDVTLSRIVRNPVNGESRGFGFVDMKDDDGADEVSLFWSISTDRTISGPLFSQSTVVGPFCISCVQGKNSLGF